MLNVLTRDWTVSICRHGHVCVGSLRYLQMVGFFSINSRQITSFLCLWYMSSKNKPSNRLYLQLEITTIDCWYLQIHWLENCTELICDSKYHFTCINMLYQHAEITIIIQFWKGLSISDWFLDMLKLVLRMAAECQWQVLLKKVKKIQQHRVGKPFVL